MPGLLSFRGRALAVVAVVVALAAAALIYFVFIDSDDGSDCGNVATRPVTELPVTPERYDEAIAGLQQVQDLAGQAEEAPPEERMALLDEAFEVFYASSDNLMHDADFELCEADYEFAERIREDMLALEVAIGNQNNPEAIVDLAAMLEARLGEAKEVLF